MRRLSATELARLAGTQTEAMNDVCNIYNVSFSSGTYGSQTEEVRSLVSGVACGIQYTGGRTIQRGQVLLVDYDVVLRLASDTPVGMEDDIELIQKGNTMVSGTFKPFAHPQINSSVQHVLLKRSA